MFIQVMISQQYFVEADDGSVAIANSDFSLVMEGQYLTADEAIAYMGAAANYIN